MNALPVISLFTGAGGLDLGLHAAGFDTRVAVEMDRAAVETLRHNADAGRVSWQVIDRDIHDVKSSAILEAGQLRRGEAALLVGGPPCQPFSKSGYWKTGDSLRLDDPRAATLMAYLRVLDETRPAAYMLENVEGLSYRGKSEGVNMLRDAILELGYTFELRKFNAAEYGVPQLRQRVIIFGTREGDPIGEFPATHRLEGKEPQSELTFGEDLPLAMTAGDALHGLPKPDEPGLEMGGKWAALLPTIPAGENYLWHTDRGGGQALFGWRRRYWSFLLKLSPALPSWTITAQPGSAIGPFHWDNRKLSTRELARIQTFPDWYEVLGGRTAVQRQIGNAVPSALAEHVGLVLKERLFGHPAATSAASLIPARAPSWPSPTHKKRLPAVYKDLVGKHAEHPGTGKGYAASSREPETTPS